MHFLAKEHRPLFLFITFVAVIRLFLSLHVGLGVDEAHYVLYGIHLDWSYFDHPPLVGWTDALFTSLFGVNAFGARFGAIAIGFFTSILLYKLIFDLSHNTKTAFVAILALHASFLFNALFIMLLPDTFLFLLIVPLIWSVLALEKDDSLKNWLILGVLLGIGGLAKYTAVLFLVPILLYILIKKRWDLLLNLKIIPAIFVAMLLISPVLYWNIEHHWISFTYQSEHVVGAELISFNAIFNSLAAQFGAYNPFLFPVAFYGLYKALKSKNDTLFLSGLFGGVLIAFFTYASLYKTALPHWSALFYLLFIPIGSYFILESKRYKKALHVSVIFGLFLSALAYGELGFRFIPQAPYASLHRDIYGWETIMKEANMLIKDNTKEALAVTNWTLASRAIFYNQPYQSSVFLIDNRFDQFDLWQKGSPLGKDLIIIDSHFFHQDSNATIKCDAIIENKSFDILLHNTPVDTIKLLTCKHFQGLR